VAFFSKTFSLANQKLSIYEKEFLAVLMVVDKWRHYLLKKSFIIRTDHKSFCHLQDQSLSIEMQRKVMSKLAGLQLKLVYKKGSENSIVDALSRVAHYFNISTVSIVVPIWIQEIVNSYVVDPEAQNLLQELAVVSPNASGYSLQDGFIKFKGRVWVGANTALQTKIIQAFHASTMGRHLGIQAAYQKLHKLFS
jgi:hypothetical protein